MAGSFDTFGQPRVNVNCTLRIPRHRGRRSTPMADSIPL
jgi:hypothetical protein